MLAKPYLRRFTTFCHLHRKRLALATGFTGLYLATAEYVKEYSANEMVRMGMTGSLTNVICEVLFHAVDTVNIRAKVYKEKISTVTMLRKIMNKEGMYGFVKGISATFYGSIFCGFVYFSMYKYLKSLLKDYFGERSEFLLYFISSGLAEIFTLVIYYPYDLVKARLQTRNAFYQYKNLLDAFRKIVTNETFFSLYQGSLSYLITYTLYISIQFTIYEGIIVHFKRKRATVEDTLSEYQVILIGSFLSGAIASALTNGFEVVTVRKQTSPEIKIIDILKKEKFGFFTKGLAARVYYHSIQSIVFFTLLAYVGKKFGVDLSD